MKKPNTQKRMNDDAVKSKTGKTLSEWFRILDDLGAKKLPHKEIVKHLHEKENVPGWWCQMVTVEYERARGLRELHQKSSGEFAASASRTLDAPLSKVYEAWADETQRSRWLPKGNIQVTTATKNKYFRAAWDGNKSRINVGFYAKGTDRCQVALDHEKLRSAAECAKMKKHWHAAFTQLETYLEE
jgi:hypothetical protein